MRGCAASAFERRLTTGDLRGRRLAAMSLLHHPVPQRKSVGGLTAIRIERPLSDVAAVAAARSRLDSSLSGYEPSRSTRDAVQAVARVLRAREGALREHSTRRRETRDASDAIRRTAGGETSSARECTAHHRSAVEHGVRRIRAQPSTRRGAPEKVLVAVKGRLAHAVTATMPGRATASRRPRWRRTSADWAISALYDAA